MVHFLALLVCVIGLVLYVLPVPPQIRELGRIMFAAGLLVALWRFSV
jgi:Na+/phosphate symporter